MLESAGAILDLMVNEADPVVCKDIFPVCSESRIGIADSKL